MLVSHSPPLFTPLPPPPPSAGFIADYDRNGWSSGSPAFSGDYFIPGSPVEGWVAEWTDGGNFATVNKGLVGGSAMSDTAIEVTSHGNKQVSLKSINHDDVAS